MWMTECPKCSSALAFADTPNGTLAWCRACGWQNFPTPEEWAAYESTLRHIRGAARQEAPSVSS